MPFEDGIVDATFDGGVEACLVVLFATFGKDMRGIIGEGISNARATTFCGGRERGENMIPGANAGLSGRWFQMTHEAGMSLIF